MMQDVELGEQSNHIEVDNIDEPLIERGKLMTKPVIFVCICVPVVAVLVLILTLAAIVITSLNSIQPEICSTIPPSFDKVGVYTMNKDYISGKFYIYSSNDTNYFASMKQRQYAYPYAIDLVNEKDSGSISVGTNKFFSFGTSLNVEGCNEKFTNTIRQRLQVLQFGYIVLDAGGTEVLSIDSEGKFSTSFLATDAQGVEYARVYRTFIALNEKWVVELYKTHPKINAQTYFHLAAVISYANS
ncbi:tRNA pseudouridine synthase A [Acrasis kona]|uniref:tRNA pseudouridine synthase A n=1 Tax=Acrasis kona TaxID=1008807 RepID=A0AAW2ZIY2_9EUKA